MPADNRGGSQRRATRVPEVPAQYRTPEFIDLRRHWYNRLKTSGFDDIEWQSANGSEGPHIRNSACKVAGLIQAGRARLVEEFYLACAELLHTYEFEDTRERRIWEWYCEGHTYNEIAEKLRRTRHRHIGPVGVMRICVRLQRVVRGR